MNNKHKIIKFSAITATILGGFITPLFASNFFTTYGYSNFTSGGKFKITDPSGKTVGTAYTTPSFSFRFKNNNNYEPIFRASPPAIQAGCNGLNIKGMFVSIINLERLSEMLKNAGASLAWGVLVGLIYSLPGIAATFRNLNQWAKMIQQLMQNACRSGIAIGKMIMNKTNLDKHAGEDLSFIPSPQDLIKDSDNPEQKEKDIFGIKGLNFDTNTMALSFDSDSEVTPSQALKAWFKALSRAFYVPTYNGFIVSSIIGKMDSTHRKNIFANIVNVSSNQPFGVGLMCVSLDNTVNSSNCKSENVNSNTVSVYILSAGSSDFQGAFSSDDQKYNALMQVWTLGLISNFGYDQYITPISALNTQAAISKAYKTNMGEESVDEKNSKFLKDLLDGHIGAVQAVPINHPNAEQSMESLARNLAEVAYLGADASDSNATTVNAMARIQPLLLSETKLKKMKAPLFTIVGMANPEESGEQMYYILFSGVSSGNAPFLDINSFAEDFKLGAYANSYKIIKDMLKNGINTALAGARYFIVPGITKKIAILQRLPDGPRKEKYIAMLARYNAYFAVKSFLENVFDGGSDFKAYPPVFYTDSSSNAPTPFGKYQGLKPDKTYLDNFIGNTNKNTAILAKAKATALNKLKDLVGNNIPSSEKLDALFFQLEKEIREKALEKVAK